MRSKRVAPILYALPAVLAAGFAVWQQIELSKTKETVVALTQINYGHLLSSKQACDMLYRAGDQPTDELADRVTILKLFQATLVNTGHGMVQMGVIEESALEPLRRPIGEKMPDPFVNYQPVQAWGKGEQGRFNGSS